MTPAERIRARLHSHCSWSGNAAEGCSPVYARTAEGCVLTSEAAPAAILIVFHSLPHFTKRPDSLADGAFISLMTQREKNSGGYDKRHRSASAIKPPVVTLSWTEVSVRDGLFQSAWRQLIITPFTKTQHLFIYLFI